MSSGKIAAKIRAKTLHVKKTSKAEERDALRHQRALEKEISKAKRHAE